RSSSRCQRLGESSGGTHPKPSDILPAISIDWVRTNFFRSWDVRTGHDHFLDGNARLASGLRRGCELLRERYEDGAKAACDDRETPSDSGRLHCRAFL